jgi:hypothetical protein
MLNKHNLGEELGAPMIVLMAAALVGGVGSFVVLWPYGALAALLGAQFGLPGPHGGSVSGLAQGEGGAESECRVQPRLKRLRRRGLLRSADSKLQERTLTGAWRSLHR